MTSRTDPAHRRTPSRGTVTRSDHGLFGAFVHIWGHVGLMCALALIFVCGLTQPASPGGEVPALVGEMRTVSTALGEIQIAPVKVYSSGAVVEVHAELAATPDELLAQPDQVLAPSPGHAEYALTLHTKHNGTTTAPDVTQPSGASADYRKHHWNVAFWVPRKAWSDSAPRLVWPVAHVDVPLHFNRVELTKAARVVRTRD